MSRKRVPRRIRKQEWKVAGYRTPSAMRKDSSLRCSLVALLSAFTRAARSIEAMATNYARTMSLDDSAHHVGLMRMIDESDDELRQRMRERLSGHMVNS